MSKKINLSKPKAEVIEKTNEVHKLIIQKNVLNWNKKFEDFSGRFRINPYSMTIITAKPTQINPREGVEAYKASIYRDPTEEAFSSEFLKRTVIRGTMPPSNKYLIPQTAAQEIGWISAPVLPRIHSSQWNRRVKKPCFETFFAEEYIKFRGKNPYFARK
jgi:FAM183A and FAM183B related